MGFSPESYTFMTMVRLQNHEIILELKKQTATGT